ncbi:hypothetical protein ALO75_03724 [Pseudomonas syringae pv. coryli]|uniref:Uncharacterized protein n=1 Tax=Pseudomonas syringae pv. coryli TaxID=317659 RepID=A0A0P9N5R4_9PSED|nr:hypothetical protein ALO75_03724 [Pseudomonas syringae pv. coryli]
MCHFERFILHRCCERSDTQILYARTAIFRDLFPWQNKAQRPPPLPALTSAWACGYRRSSTRPPRRNPGLPCSFVSRTRQKTTGRNCLKK